MKSCESLLLLVIFGLLGEKIIFWGIRQSTSVLVHTQKNHFFAWFCNKILLFWSILAQKMLSIWSVQHPNAGRNIQQIRDQYKYLANMFAKRCIKTHSKRVNAKNLSKENKNPNSLQIYFLLFKLIQNCITWFYI